jgi:hypothetical protein
MGGGFGMLALASLLNEDGLLIGSAEARSTIGPVRSGPSAAHFASRARSVIFVFCTGGPSHLETFDPKPELERLDGQKLPPSFGKVWTRRDVDKNLLLAPQVKFRPAGQCGHSVSEWLPALAMCADELALLRGCYCDNPLHPRAILQMNTGSTLMGKPSMGAWITYGLGSENRDFPAFVVLADPAGEPAGGAGSWGAGFLPAANQGTVLRGGPMPILHLRPPESISTLEQGRTLQLVQELNRRHLAARPEDSALQARIESYELAYRMQLRAPELIDIAGESDETRRLYGMDQKETADLGTRCLLARRLVERGVRFVQLYHGGRGSWDAHQNVKSNHEARCRELDRPLAGLIKDLKRRGLLDETLVVWGGEFGRTPMSESKTGRSSAIPMRSASGPKRTGRTCRTCTRRSSTSWAWTTPS